MTENQSLSVAVVVGSLRRASVTRTLARSLIEAAPPALRCRMLEIGDLPLYDEDLETDDPPQAWVRFRAAVAASDGVLFVTPEYNRSVPAPLKNAIDVGSAPHGANVFAGIPAGIVSASPGRMGAFGANHHLRQSLVFLDMPAMQQPELYLGGSHALHNAGGGVASPDVHDLLAGFMGAFASWVARHHPVRV